MLRKILIVGVGLPYTVYHLYKIREQIWMKLVHVIKFLSQN
jgi:hypothetical protein